MIVLLTEHRYEGLLIKELFLIKELLQVLVIKSRVEGGVLVLGIRAFNKRSHRNRHT
jgi:hypothetical protein